MLVAVPMALFGAILAGQATAHVSPREGISWDLGAADALLYDSGATGPVTQDGNGYELYPLKDHSETRKPYTRDEIEGLFPEGSRAIPINVDNGPRQDWPGVVAELDLKDPLTRGMYPLESGRYPAAKGELLVVASEYDDIRAAVGGFQPGSRFAETVKIVGVAKDIRRHWLPPTVSFPGSGLVENGGRWHQWLVDTPQPIGWEQVGALNQKGLYVRSRAVVNNPPRPDERAEALDREYHLTQPDYSKALIWGVAVCVVLVYPGLVFLLRGRRRLIVVQLILAVPVSIGLGLLCASWLTPSFAESAIGPFEVPWQQVLVVAAVGEAVIALALPRAIGRAVFGG
ncbi:putative ABC transporter integral membrane protein [[Actinomadura] parvosata subsp. kistnae]|uniref:DUF4436 domain-containing protein n=1 Tax=[Actinomadura] parvosata subsp. kistnae TaxID=1909395 RepID=A0A1V0AH13_9ACTN|nr:hypothetical protein BKM31_55605 [Nonomuraea sp. ATCC 55076]SPL91859.1 putative ABC transporter integral membrane protein [Actinomadura parvosata subsp. kistnae]